MAAGMFDKGREGFLDGSIDWDSVNIKVSLVRGTAPVLTTQTSVSDFTTAGGVIVATSANLASKTVTAGVADAADVTFTAVTAGAAITGVLIYQSGSVGSPGTDVATNLQRLIAYSDAYTGLPVTPNGGDITIAFDSGANRIFKL